MDGRGVYLQPEAAYATANMQRRTMDESLAIQPQALWTRMREAGALASCNPEQGKTRNTLKKSHCEQHGRWLHLPLEFFGEGRKQVAESAEIIAFPAVEER